jgi:hypothetical protein
VQGPQRRKYISLIWGISKSDLYSLLPVMSAVMKSPLVSLPPEKMPSRSQLRICQRPVLLASRKT